MTVFEECDNSHATSEGENMQTSEGSKEMGWVIEDAQPLNLQYAELEKDPEFEESLWVHQNIIRLSKEFGVDFRGCENKL